MLKTISMFTMIAISLVFQPAGFAQAAKQPLLTITGKINKTNTPDKKSYVITQAEFKKLPRQTIKATTDYSKDTSYTGPLMSDILKLVEADKNSKYIIITGLDGYKIRAPMSDFQKYEVIIADTAGGVPMTIDTKGPFWTIYPIDKYKAELNDVTTSSKMVWALVSIDVK
ncbi:molybdopterin-dependent oxidoreductase [Rhodoferax antarcticus]|uniref:molybdopterin-dependent oxidoreductase n=1 Tax=Rhodoferax antarcticus TaxID=81479 RepID=UPI00094F885F|nr:molybdopterin-dependent oxidoreductase [Rhodoferax antarcticus]